ncbi:MAG: type II secretion system protein [Kiritimatiellaeota bacterium]|nr:type II secretion system protein [Kiritimatiellota bacterium]
MIELLVVIVIIAILAGLLLPAVIGGIKKGDITQAQSECRLLETAMMSYLQDYGKFPGQFDDGSGGGNADYHIYQEYDDLFRILRGTNDSGSVKDLLGLPGCSNWKNQNPRRNVYLTINEKSIATNAPSGQKNWDPAGKVKTKAEVGDLSDPWGNRYVVVADWNNDGKVWADDENASARILRRIAVWSWGPDPTAVGIPSTTNTSHIRTWKN